MKNEFLGKGQTVYEQPPIDKIINNNRIFPENFFTDNPNSRELFVRSAVLNRSIPRGVVNPTLLTRSDLVKSDLLDEIDQYPYLRQYLGEKLIGAYSKKDGSRHNNARIPDRTYVAYAESRPDKTNTVMHGSPDLNYAKPEEVKSNLPPKRKPNRFFRFFKSQND